MPVNTIKMIAASARSISANGIFCVVLLGLSACGSMKPAPRPVVYDLGPGALTPVATNGLAALPALVLTEVDAPAALEGSPVLYRLAYSDAQQLRPYAQARWSMPPAQLLRQRLREQLGLRRAVLSPTQGVAAPPLPMVLHVELEEFSQLFDTAEHSVGLLRLRATLTQPVPGARLLAQELVAQRGFVLQRPADGADAAAGVRALTVAVDAAIADIAQWVEQTQAQAQSPIKAEHAGASAR